MSKRMSRYPCDTKVYVGDLGNHARKNELEDSFSYYGPLRSVWIARNPPGFAFVEFESARDAEDAVRGLDGRIICGRRARVEVSSGKSGRGYRGSKSRRPYHQDRCYECGDRGHYARDCRRHGKSRRRSRSRSARSRSPRERRSRSASGSRSRSRSVRNGSPRDRRSRSNSVSRSRSRTPQRNGRAPVTKNRRRARSESAGDSKSPPKRSMSRSRSRSDDKSDD
ncbi:serine/arginine-rich splicing factor 7 isoform X2 [Contarinia nasturtii]|uniref:serine/arginine-rich splicing factor 7 isoform X2 n=1 Tax=Contarinia nasturtii TaxID=265458 RepID=UPI0012D372D2|nr:serine/arginine-rich splicing factor 7 isoform X2 [Contarinia nasturtii]